jgi:hypothetical protein
VSQQCEHRVLRIVFEKRGEEVAVKVGHDDIRAEIDRKRHTDQPNARSELQ